MGAGLSATLDHERVIKAAFVSYYLSMYNTVSREIGFQGSAVSVDEIYDFIRDIKHEEGRQLLDISREDIQFCFHVLHLAGVCKK